MFRRTACYAFAALMISGSAFAQTIITDGEYMAVEKFDGTQLYFQFEKMPKEANAIVLRVQGPKEFSGEVMSGNEVPAMDLRRYAEDELADGLYFYELGGTTGEKYELPKHEILDNGRGKEVSRIGYKTFLMSGQFMVKKGRIVIPDPDKVDETEPGKGEDKVSIDLDGSEKPGERADENGQIGKPEEPKDGDRG